VENGTTHYHFSVGNTTFGLRFERAVYTGYLRLMI
tara:strand:+ start:366 stop:470 length:105 start_codon:yes stop_codon:yes gene_type:complete